ncbi:hypothetical protein ENBRE01_3402 [Enteropsectra breve]|nr:hypothetical protein ENBRE01_3402 [Enteropsectra breve]
MAEHVKWTVTMTENLIRLKHSEEMCLRFEDALNKPQRMKASWMLVGGAFQPPISGELCKIKYNQLLAKYRDVLTESNRTGASAPKWKYWDIFKSTFPSNIQHTMQDVLEIGDESFSNTSMQDLVSNVESSPVERTKENQAATYKALKMKTYEAILKRYETSSAAVAKSSLMEERIDSLETKIDAIISLLMNKKDDPTGDKQNIFN